MVGYCVAVQTQRYFLTMCFYITVMGLWGSIVSFSYHWDEIVYMTPTCWDDIVYAWGVLCSVPGQLWQDPEGSITRAFWATLFYEKPLIITLPVTQVALLAVVGGITFFSQGIWNVYIGLAQKERYHLGGIATGEQYHSTFVERFLFMFGSNFPLGLLWPMKWEEVEWSGKFIDSVLLHPLIADEDITEVTDDAGQSTEA
ncbi:unnamed protein product, partial [Mesorhabditis spiculigera]